MLTRRSFLTGLSAMYGAAVLTSAVARAEGANVDPSLPLTIANNTGSFDNATISVCIIGVNTSTGEQSRVTPDGRLVPVSPSDNGSDGYADYSIPLRTTGDTTLTLPSMSGRIYFALGSKLKFKVVTGGDGKPALQYPAGWVPSDPNYRVLHDFAEFTLNSSGMFCNTTMVDMFSVPLAINLKGAQDQTTGTLVDGGRQKIFSGIAANPDFAQLKQEDLRVIAPGHGLDLGTFAKNYYDSYIDQVWSKYRSTQLRVRTSDGRTFTGQVSGDTFTFDGGVQPIRRPSTRDLLFCDGALAAPNDGVTGPVAATLGAALNRSTLLDFAEQPATDPSQFYRNPLTNHYAQVMHANTKDGKAYGFAFDDVANFASYIQDTAPTAITLTLTPW